SMSASRHTHSQRSEAPVQAGILDRLEELEEDMEGGAWNPPRASVILSVCYSGGMIGAAVYDQAKTTVHLVRDVAEECHFPVLSHILERVNPTRILTNCAQDVNMVNFLSKACGISIAEDDDVTQTMDETVNSSKREEGGAEGAGNGKAFLPPRSGSVARDGEQGKSAEVEETTGDDGLEPVQKWVNEQPSKFSRSSQRTLSDGRAMSAEPLRRATIRDDEDATPSDEDDDEEEEEGEGERTTAPAIAAELQKLSNCTYNCDRALVRIAELFESEALSECEAGLITRFRIDTGSANMVRALGALLHHMDSARVGVEFLLPTARTPVTAIKTMMVQEMVEMDAMTFRALGIFAVDPGTDTTVRNVEHAKLINKDRFSLFGICCRCRSAPGKRMLRKWFSRPTRDSTVLQNRHDAVAFLANDENKDIGVYLQRVLKPVRSLKTTMKRLRASSMKINDWIGLHSSVHHLRELGHLLHSGRFRLKIMAEFKPFFDDRLEEVKTIMEALIDYDESRVENRMVVRVGLDADVDQMKATYRSLPDNLTRAAKNEAVRLGSPSSCAVGYVPMVGYLLQLPAHFDYQQYDDLEFLYEDGQSLHVKSDMMRRLDEEIGDIKMQIIDRETTIMLRLERLLISRSRVIITCVRAAAVIDCCLSLATTANMFGWCRPTIVEEAVIQAKGVVHPLAQLTVASNFVANPIESGGDDTKVKIFTGPNACGKSVYLKQVGLLCYLAHVGSFVPAVSAKIGLLTGILTRMYTLDGVLDGMSTFAKDVGQLSFALRRSTGHSLVIIDEFGKGTMTEVGLSLLTASVEHLVNKGKEACPHLLVSTHFHALIDLLDTDQSAITYNTLEVLRKGTLLYFQFKLVEGIVTSSFAAFTAAKAGIPQRAVERANKIYEHLRDGGRLCDMRLGIEGEEEMNEWLHGQMESAVAWMEGWELTEDDEEERVDELIEMLRKHLFTADERNEGNEDREEGMEEDDNDGREAVVAEPEVRREVEPEETVQPQEKDEITPPPTAEPPTENTVDKEGDGSQDTVVREVNTVHPAAEAIDQPRDTVYGSKDTVEQAAPIDEEQPSQRVYTFPWEHEDEEEEEKEEGEEGENSTLADEGDALRDVTFPWELEKSLDEEEEEEGEQEKEKDLQGRPDDETLDTSHAILHPLEDTSNAENSSTTKSSDVLNSTTNSILKGSARRGDRTIDRSNLSVSFSK
ncbi:msh-5, partial [Pristionchus pacificus]